MAEIVPFTLRPATRDDAGFLFALHEAAMREVIEATWGWDEAWQRAYFSEHFTSEGISVIVVEGEPAGMLEVDERPAECFVANIKLMPAVQGRGIGSAVMRRVIAGAAARGVPVTLQVLQANAAARRLYRRLGFVETGERPPHVLMARAAG